MIPLVLAALLFAPGGHRPHPEIHNDAQVLRLALPLLHFRDRRHGALHGTLRSDAAAMDWSIPRNTLPLTPTSRLSLEATARF